MVVQHTVNVRVPGSSPGPGANASLAQRQSTGFVNRRSSVQSRQLAPFLFQTTQLCKNLSMIKLQTMSYTEIIEVVERYEKIKKLVSILDTMPDSKKGLSLLNYDTLLAIRKVLGTNNAWDVISDRTRFKRELKKNNFTI